MMTKDSPDVLSKSTLNGRKYIIIINSYNGENLPKFAKDYDRKEKADKKEGNYYYLMCDKHIKPDLPWGLDVLYRYVWLGNMNLFLY